MSFLPEHKDWIDLTDLVISFIGLFVGGALAWQANKIAKSNLELAESQQKTLKQKITSEDREVFRSNYKKVTDALGIVFREGKVDDEAKDLFWQARDEARLELSEDIEIYTQGLFDQMWKAYLLYYNKISGDTRLPVGEERTSAVNDHCEIISNLIKERPSLVYSKHMKIDSN